MSSLILLSIIGDHITGSASSVSFTEGFVYIDTLAIVLFKITTNHRIFLCFSLSLVLKYKENAKCTFEIGQ